MKFLRKTALMLSLLAFAACEKQPVTYDATLTMAQEEKNIGPDKGDYTLLYIYNHGGGEVATAETSASWITNLDASEPGKVKFSVQTNYGPERRAALKVVIGNLSAGTTIIQADGSNADHQPQEPHDRNVTATYAWGQYNGSGDMDPETGDKGANGNFTLILSDKAIGPDGQLQEAGFYYRLDLYATTPFDPRNASLPDGTYTLADVKQPWEGFVLGKTNSLVTRIGAGSIAEDEYNIESGKLTVKGNSYNLDITTNDGSHHVVKANAAVEFVNNSKDYYPLYPITENLETRFISGNMIHYESVSDEWSNYLVYFSDMERNADGYYAPPGNMLTISLWGRPVSHYDRNLQSATYSLTTNYNGAAGGFMVGYNFLMMDGINVIPAGTYVTRAADTSADPLYYGFARGGTITIDYDASANSYHAVIDLVLAGGYTFKASFDGAMSVQDNDPYEEPEEPIEDEPVSTISGDVATNFTAGGTLLRARYAGAYYQQSRKVTSDWIIQLVPNQDGDGTVHEYLSFEIIDWYHPFDYYTSGLPEGVFQTSLDEEYQYAPYTFVPGYMENGSLHGTYYAKLDDSYNSIQEYAVLSDGNLRIVKNADGTFTLSWTLFDDHATPYTIGGSYTGRIDYIDDVSQDDGKEDVDLGLNVLHR